MLMLMSGLETISTTTLSYFEINHLSGIKGLLNIKYLLELKCLASFCESEPTTISQRTVWSLLTKEPLAFPWEPSWDLMT